MLFLMQQVDVFAILDTTYQVGRVLVVPAIVTVPLAIQKQLALLAKTLMPYLILSGVSAKQDFILKDRAVNSVSLTAKPANLVSHV